MPEPASWAVGSGDIRSQAPVYLVVKGGLLGVPHGDGPGMRMRGRGLCQTGPEVPFLQSSPFLLDSKVRILTAAVQLSKRWAPAWRHVGGGGPNFLRSADFFLDLQESFLTRDDHQHSFWSPEGRIMVNWGGQADPEAALKPLPGPINNMSWVPTVSQTQVSSHPRWP